MKYACFYQKPNKFIVHAQAQTDGPMIASEPFFILSRDVTVKQLTDCLTTCLKAFSIGRELPKNWSEHSKSFLKNCKEPSLKRLHENALYCSVGLENDVLTFYPTRNLGSRQGFDFLAGQEIRIPLSEMADGLIDALKRCF